MSEATASAALVEQREQFATKQREIAEIFELAKDGNRFDLSRKNVMEKLGAADPGDALLKVKARNRELDDLGAALQQAELKSINESIGERDTLRNAPARGGDMVHLNGGEAKTWTQLFVEHKDFKAAVKHPRHECMIDLDVGLKTLMTTAAGFAPESVRSGLLVEAVTRPIQVTDLIPTFPIGQPSFVYMEETTRTHSAAEKAEGVAYAESAFVWTQKTSPVQKITDSIPVTDEQLEDEAQVRSLLEQRLSFGIRQRLDLQILVGTGVSPLLLGLNAVVGIQTQAKGGDATIAAFMKALTKVRFTGRASPNGAVFHPNDWQDVVLTQNSNGDFLFGNPFQGSGPNSLFGIPIAVSDAQTENTALIADFANFTRLDDRRGVTVSTGYVADQFKEGKLTIRADMRVAFTCTRPAAVCTLTGI